MIWIGVGIPSVDQWRGTLAVSIYELWNIIGEQLNERDRNTAAYQVVAYGESIHSFFKIDYLIIQLLEGPFLSDVRKLFIDASPEIWNPIKYIPIGNSCLPNLNRHRYH